MGLLGGSFDPPHLGHIHAAREAQKALGLQEVIFIPCHRQPLKPDAPAAGAFHRAAMVALATADRNDWRMETLELERQGVSFTADTLAELCERSPESEWFLLAGSDILASLPRWVRIGEILRLATLAVVPRPGWPSTIPEELTGARIRTLPCAEAPFSSSDIRRRLARGEDVSDRVPAPVLRYIEKEALYGAASADGRR